MASFHLRSISLPSRSHPLTVSLEVQLHKLKTRESSSIGHRLAGLKELYERVDDFLQLSLTQQALSNSKQNQYVEAALNESLVLLEMYSNTIIFFSQIRECMQELKISLRRKRGGESSVNEVDSYTISRKKMTQVVCKYLRNLKKQGKKCRTADLANNSKLVNVTTMLQGVQETSFQVFESVLSFISQPKTKSKLSVVLKLLHSKHVSGEVRVEDNEMLKIDAELLGLKSNKDMNQMQNALKGLEELELSLQEAEEELERVYRRLVKIRVSLLNILNH